MSKKLNGFPFQSPYAPDPGALPIDLAPDEPLVSREVHEQLCRLRTGDPSTVKEVLLSAFQISPNNGFNFLVPACIIIRDVAMCERLVRIVVELGRYSAFVLDALAAYEQIAESTPSDEVRRSAVAGVHEFLHGMYLDDLRLYTPAAQDATRRLIEQATTGTRKASEESPPRPASIRRASDSTTRRKKTTVTTKARPEQHPAQHMEQAI